MKKDIKPEIMEYEELLHILDISEPDEFEYFENMADLIECENDIADEALVKLFRGVDEETLAELIGSYFSDILENLPEHQDDIYILINTIGMNLIGLARAKEDNEGRNLAVFAEEFNRFKRWYMFDTEVLCTEIKLGEVLTVPVAEAAAVYRSETATKTKYDYDFEKALNYPLSDYIMSFGDLMTAEYSENDNDDDYEYEHHNHNHGSCGSHDNGHMHVHREEGLAYGFASDEVLNDGFVYDDEFCPEEY
ncbi:MAG: hypothetical protein HFG67_04195 [Firmicutes bacterium]|nr:hypothetical protein [Bacillota bacterium]